MADIRMNVKCSLELKKAFEVFCNNLSKDPSEVLRLFVNKVVDRNDIPAIFDIADYRTFAGRDGDCLVRVFFRVELEEKQQFQEVCLRYNIPMSRIIKMFMMRCLKEGAIPSALN